jgi:iron complex outermembrane receptor protein
MRISSLFLCAALATPVSLVLLPNKTYAQDTELTTLEDVVVLGSRRLQPRSSADSPVPVDVISEEEFSRAGNVADTTDNLLNSVPSFNATTATGDSDSFSRPVSLRGMAQDQILLLVNGKRRHRSAVITEFAPAAAAGAQGPNIGMIPAIAIDQIEVLRDGASAQYGADAIAGVINLRLKDSSQGGTTRVQYGQFYEGEMSTRFEGNVGAPLGSDDGFVNLSIEYTDNEALSRGFQRPEAQAQIEAGIAGIGADSPFGDGLAQSWGRPETGNLLLFVNSALPLANASELYLQGNYAKVDGRFRFFYRRPEHPCPANAQERCAAHAAVAWLEERGYTGSVLDTGFTPYLDGRQLDYSLVGGIRGNFPAGITFDFSAGTGSNKLDHYLHNAVSYAVDPTPNEIGQRTFYIGYFEQEELTLNADFTTFLSDDLHLAFGAEWREETWSLGAGESNAQGSLDDPTCCGTSASGMVGFRSENAGSWSRSNTALYAELEQDLTNQLFLQYALRREDYSDFGTVTIGKVAGRYDITDSMVLRGSISTGFHAPTPGQSNFQRKTTTFDCPEAGGDFVGECILGHVPAESLSAVAQGGGPLKEEESRNYTIGTGFGLGTFGNLTVDLYRIDVSDRIYKVDPPIQTYTDANGQVTDDVAQATTYSGVLFFTNVLDVRSSGIDVVLTNRVYWNSNLSSLFTFSYNYNDFQVVGQDDIAGSQLVSPDNIAKIENSYPKHRFVASANTTFENWDFLVRANYFGKHYDVDQGQILQGSSTPIDPVVFIDFEIGYQLSDALKLVAGASNIFDTYIEKFNPDRCRNPCGNRLHHGLPYPRRAASNYEGGSWYLQATYTF